MEKVGAMHYLLRLNEFLRENEMPSSVHNLDYQTLNVNRPLVLYR